jgi:hypothetical protein
MEGADSPEGTVTPVDTILRSQLRRFLKEAAPWKLPLQEIVEMLGLSGWQSVVFGGVLRDLVLYGPAKRPRDVDIVVDCSPGELAAWLSDFPVQRTSFGGFRIQHRKWSFDIWSLKDTWAFKEGHMSATFDNLPKTTFFNVEATAAQLNPAPKRKRRLYSFGFAKAMSSRILDINFEPNPFPQLCIIRGLLTAARHRLLVSPRLAEYMTQKASRAEIADIVRVQFKHYGVVRLRSEDIVTWLDHIENKLSIDPHAPIRLPQTAGEQLSLLTFDRLEMLESIPSGDHI